MLGLDITSVALSGVSLIGGGIAGVINAGNRKRANYAEANYNLGLLENEQTYLEQNYSTSQEDLQNSLMSTLMSNSQGLWSSGRLQQESAELASVAAINSQIAGYEQLADIQRQGMQAEGSAVANASVSGFRNTGSVQGAVNQASEQYSRAYSSARRQLQASSYQSYMQAASNYFQGNMQMESYRQSSRDAQRTFDNRMESLRNEYTYNSNRLDAEIGYWTEIRNANEGPLTFLEGLAAFFGG